MSAHVPVTDRAKRVIELAEDFACSWADPSVEAEHLLFALAAEGDGLAAQLLKSLGADADAIRNHLLDLDATPSAMASGATLKLEELQRFAYEELEPLGHNYIGTEHLLLALTHVTGGRCLAVLMALKLDRDVIRHEVYSVLGHFA